MGQGLLTEAPADLPGLLSDGGLARTREGRLELERVDLEELARAVGTPAFVYNADVARRRYQALDRAFGAMAHRVHYAVKANGNLAVLRLFRELGAGADIVSAGELARAREAGFDPASVVFSGVGKTAAELWTAVDAGLGSIHVESLEELAQLGRISEEEGKNVRIGVRFNPDVTADTHPFITTGSSGIKFGIPADQVDEVASGLRAYPRLRLVTVAIHLGSQIVDLEPYRRGAARLVELLSALQAQGVTTIEALDLGGGLGIRYRNEEPPTAQDFADAVVPVLRPTGLPVHLEPGRYLIGSAGVLLTTVLYVKRAGGKVFVVVDAGMTDLVRPSRYDAYHHIVPVLQRHGALGPVDVVGPVCETGDFLALGRPFPQVAPGDVLAVLGAGAYGFVMGSTYNGRPRPPEVLVTGDSFRIVRRRESVDDLLATERLS